MKAKDPKPCKVEGCERKAAPGRRVCYGCHKAAIRSRNPVWAAWSQIRARAIRRRIPFALSLDEFRAFVDGAGYIEGRGRNADCLHLDRIDATRGYMLGNLQILSASENCAKGRTERGRVLEDWEEYAKGVWEAERRMDLEWDEFAEAMERGMKAATEAAGFPF